MTKTTANSANDASNPLKEALNKLKVNAVYDFTIPFEKFFNKKIPKDNKILLFHIEENKDPHNFQIYLNRKRVFSNSHTIMSTAAHSLITHQAHINVIKKLVPDNFHDNYDLLFSNVLSLPDNFDTNKDAFLILNNFNKPLNKKIFTYLVAEPSAKEKLSKLMSVVQAREDVTLPSPPPEFLMPAPQPYIQDPRGYVFCPPPPEFLMPVPQPNIQNPRGYVFYPPPEFLMPAPQPYIQDPRGYVFCPPPEFLMPYHDNRQPVYPIDQTPFVSNLTNPRTTTTTTTTTTSTTTRPIELNDQDQSVADDREHRATNPTRLPVGKPCKTLVLFFENQENQENTTQNNKRNLELFNEEDAEVTMDEEDKTHLRKKYKS